MSKECTVPTYQIADGKGPQMVTTGVVNEEQEWVEDPTTRKRRPGGQARDEHGVPLWKVEVVYQAEAYGRVESQTSTVTVPAPTQPHFAMYEPVAFEGLSVSVRVIRASGALVESWSAQGVKGATRKAEDKAAA